MIDSQYSEKKSVSAVEQSSNDKKVETKNVPRRHVSNTLEAQVRSK